MFAFVPALLETAEDLASFGLLAGAGQRVGFQIQIGQWFLGLHCPGCIEFHERFRFADVCSDVAFLAMDLAGSLLAFSLERRRPHLPPPPRCRRMTFPNSFARQAGAPHLELPRPRLHRPLNEIQHRRLRRRQRLKATCPSG